MEDAYLAKVTAGGAGGSLHFGRGGARPGRAGYGDVGIQAIGNPGVHRGDEGGDAFDFGGIDGAGDHDAFRAQGGAGLVQATKVIQHRSHIDVGKVFVQGRRHGFDAQLDVVEEMMAWDDELAPRSRALI